ncbi:ThiF family protein [Nitrosotalea devaniterrae]|uniref:ThiF family protein n=1 Tax=Nitrosotalea devaniterrae TaxID=1078905 RepID=A0A128A1W0_9ARCH|nr:ThiF family protein [Candidatus Nitrosotalea devanaterra]
MECALTFTDLINHNDDLQQIINAGYEIEISNSDLIIHNVPYVNEKKQILRGSIISHAMITSFKITPNDHQVLWTGDYPCDHNGSPMTNLGGGTNNEKIREGLVAKYSFSQKPTESGKYENHFKKIEHYVHLFENQARAIDGSVTARTFKQMPLTEQESVFNYYDTASSRAGILSINEKLKGRIAIIGLGGTGSYILDLISKTPVEEIHLFDGDKFHHHNAFRSPGAPSREDLQRDITKVEWFTEIYSKMHRKITPHPEFIIESNISKLDSMDMVFVCVDKIPSRKTIVKYLIEKKIQFIDVGIGIDKVNEVLTGSAQVTTCTSSFYEHVKTRILSGSDEDDEYSSNIQIADINALNAVLAVIKWKKMCGFYGSLENEHYTTYSIGCNEIVNDDIG